jgi:hypothetical protein
MTAMRFALMMLALSANVVFAAEKPPKTLSEADLYAFALTTVVPWNGKCEAAVKDYPRWKGFPVTRCKYADIGVTVDTYMLNADKEKISHWLASACLDAKARSGRKCIDTLWNEILTASSGGIFPIDGYVPEPGGGNVCYVFRDGVTVWTTVKKYWQKPDQGSCGTFDEADKPLSKVWKFARIVSTIRSDYRAINKDENTVDLKWVDVVRAAYQKAWNSSRNDLISARAITLAKNGAF